MEVTSGQGWGFLPAQLPPGACRGWPGCSPGTGKGGIALPTHPSVGLSAGLEVTFLG